MVSANLTTVASSSPLKIAKHPEIRSRRTYLTYDQCVKGRIRGLVRPGHGLDLDLSSRLYGIDRYNRRIYTAC